MQIRSSCSWGQMTVMTRAQCSYLFWGFADKNCRVVEAVDKDWDKLFQKPGVFYWTRYVVFNLVLDLVCCFESDFDI
jgi:hypothetical protein